MLAGVLGILTGLILGLTGAGGGILAVPALVIGLGYDMTTATPMALLAVGAAALVGALDGLRRGQVRYRAALFMAAWGAALSGAGIRVAQAVPDHWLASGFALIMVVVALRMLGVAGRAGDDGRRDASRLPCRLDPGSGRLRWTAACTTALAAIGAMTGLLAGMLGVGGGFVIVPALRRFSDISLHGVVATSLMLVALVSLSAAATSLARGTAIPPAAWTFAAAAIAGMLAGRIMAARISGRHLQVTFAGVALAVAALMLLRAWF
ncbi:MAG: sulfite exporter TauE/SafE family protein [Castellaniella sp.]